MASLLDMMDPYEAMAARTRRRYPTREPDPRSAAASRGDVTFGDMAAADPREESMLAAKGEDYNPSSLFQMALGAGRMPMAAGRTSRMLRPPLDPTMQPPPPPTRYGYAL